MVLEPKFRAELHSSLASGGTTTLYCTTPAAAKQLRFAVLKSRGAVPLTTRVRGSILTISPLPVVKVQFRETT